MQTQTSNTLHNAIMEAGSKDRPPMLATSNYVQWKSRIKRYIDTKPNHELIHYCLENPPYELGWKDKLVPDFNGNLTTTTERVFEMYKNVTQDIRDQLNAEAKAIQIILTGIDNDIYSTVDACPNACEMWKAIERLKQVGIRRVVPRNYNPKGERVLIASHFPTPPLACAFFSLRATETSSSKLARDQTSNPTSSTNPTPKGRICRSSKQKVENSYFEENLTPVDTMTDNHTMAEMLRAPTEGCAEAIVVPPILDEQFKLKHRATRRWLEKKPSCSITTCDDLVSKFINEFFPPSRTTNIRNEISNFQQKFDESFYEAWERYKDLLRVCPHHGFTELHHLDTFYNALNPADQDSLNAAAGGNLLEKSPRDVLTIIKNKSKVRNSRSKPIASPVNACDNHSSSELAKLKHAVNQQTNAVTTAMTAMLKQFQSNPPPAQVKAVEEICVTCRGAHPYYQCLAAGGNTFLEYRDNI
nr:hypothetical protein [Tanacetum cinerariifolium]